MAFDEPPNCSYTEASVIDKTVLCKLCGTLATINIYFVFQGGDLLSSHFWIEYGINSVSRRRN